MRKKRFPKKSGKEHLKSPIQVEVKESPPENPRCFLPESLETETSVEEEEIPKKSGQEHLKTIKKKKKKKKEEDLPEQKWIEGWWPARAEED